MSEGELLKKWISDNRSSAYKLASRLGIRATSVYHQMDLEKLSGSFVEKLEAAGINVFDIQIPHKSNTNIKTQQLTPIALDDVMLLNVPLVQEYAYAGYMSGYSDESYLNDLPTIPFIADKQYKGTYMAFQVRGDSMNDGSIDSYIQGDILLCREINKSYWKNRLHINKWDFVIVHKTEGILVKKITSHNPETGDIIAHSLNPMYEDLKLNLSEVGQLFNVVKVERKK